MYDRVEEKCCIEVFIFVYFIGVMYGIVYFFDLYYVKRLDFMCEWFIVLL